MLDQVISVNKPVGPTSHDIVDQIRRALPRKIKVGHAGTLDPLASGVLVIGIGPGTKQINQIMDTEKEYLAGITLGATSATDDSEGPIIITPNPPLPPSTLDIDSVISKLIGHVDQIPPAYSAIKTSGQRAYDRARSGEKFELKARKVWIKSIDVISYEYPLLTLRITTGKGVYIRSIARDIGQALGTGAYMSSLIRTKVGKWTTEQSFSPEEAIAHLASQANQQL